MITGRRTSGPLARWVRVAVGPADIEYYTGLTRFVLEGATGCALANAEIGDYRDRRRDNLPWQAPLRMAVRARFSQPAANLDGTSGFGFWNNPFEPLSGNVLAPPNALWFFCASPSSDMVVSPGLPGNGFRAEMINGGTMPAWLMALGNQLLRIPGLTRILYQAAQTQVRAGAVRLDGTEMMDWQEYAIRWDRSVAVFSVNDDPVLKVPHPPSVPLGFVAWMDNQIAVARPDGEYRFGLEPVPGRQWLELDHVEIESL